ncbi:MAG: hypothetical protein Q7S28_02565 [bacterium]|nr:hypothetical protein [bacterium]
MSDKTKHILKIAGIWVALSALIGLLLATPVLYLNAHSDSSGGRHAICGVESPDARDTDLEQIALNLDYWDHQPAAVSGKLSYAPSRETFYLRDGIFVLPLDVSDCQNLDVFKKGETPVAVKGIVANDGDSPLLVVTDLGEMVPDWAQMMFNAGIWGGIFILIGLCGELGKLLRWFLVLIGLMKPKPELSPDEVEKIKERKAGMMVIYGIFTPLVWFVNPIAGAGLQILAVVSGLSGFQSQKRKVAIVGAILCGTGLIVMTFVSVGLGLFKDPQMNFYGSGTSTAEPTGQELLELKPYINNDLHFSIHQPKGWTPDESEKGGVSFKGPQIDTVDGKPVYAEMGIAVISVKGLTANDLADFATGFKEGVAGNDKSFTVVEEGSHLLAGGRLDVYSMLATNEEKGVGKKGILVFIAKNDAIYMIGGAMPTATWDTYRQVIEDSLRTVEVWDATFAACLKGKGVVFYGELDCDFCQEQKKLFTDGTERLPYVECNTPDGKYQTDFCGKKNIEYYPTWDFADSSRITGMQTLKALSEKTGCALPK